MAEEAMTRAQLHEALEAERAKNAANEARLARLEAAVAANTETDAQRREREQRLRDAEAELAALRPGASNARPVPRGAAPKLVPYRGWVRAKQDCAYGCYRYGPSMGVDKNGRAFVDREGDLFEVDVATLWSDDPWEPVTVTQNEFGAVSFDKVRTDVQIVDAAFRARVAAA